MKGAAEATVVLEAKVIGYLPNMHPCRCESSTCQLMSHPVNQNAIGLPGLMQTPLERALTDSHPFSHLFYGGITKRNQGLDGPATVIYDGQGTSWLSFQRVTLGGNARKNLYATSFYRLLRHQNLSHIPSPANPCQSLNNSTP